MADRWELIVLGIAQDGGMPHVGCARSPCIDVREGRRAPERVACIGLRNTEAGATYLFDATPDLPAQLHDLTGGSQPTGIFLTHAHIGHYTGLMHLGKEAAGADAVPVHATPALCDFLKQNAPWNNLQSDGHVRLQPLESGSVSLEGGVRVAAFQVPHRNEQADTVGYRIDGPRASAIFVPDADRWTDEVRQQADEVDLALLDGSFASLDELPNRAIEEVRHPLMSETREHFRGTKAALWFIHLNHTNPALVEGDDVAREGMTFLL